MRGPSMNCEIIADNLLEARDELSKILDNLGHPRMTPLMFKGYIEHALNHIIIAWNVRHMPIHRYVTLDYDDFDRLCRIPDDLVPLCSDGARKQTFPPKGKFPRGRGGQYFSRHYTRSERQRTELFRTRGKPRQR